LVNLDLVLDVSDRSEDRSFVPLDVRLALIARQLVEASRATWLDPGHLLDCSWGRLFKD